MPGTWTMPGDHLEEPPYPFIIWLVCLYAFIAIAVRKALPVRLKKINSSLPGALAGCARACSGYFPSMSPKPKSALSRISSIRGNCSLLAQDPGRPFAANGDCENMAGIPGRFPLLRSLAACLIGLQREKPL